MLGLHVPAEHSYSSQFRIMAQSVRARSRSFFASHATQNFSFLYANVASVSRQVCCATRGAVLHSQMKSLPLKALVISRRT